MATPVTAFRFTDRELAQLDRLGTELLCNRTDVIRYALAALRDNPSARSQIAADNRARAFLQGLRTQYGADAVLELSDDVDGTWQLAGQPLDRAVVDVMVKRQGDRFVLDLVNPAEGVGIANVLSWDNDRRHVVVSLRDLWVHSNFGAIGEPKTHQLWDGRTVVQIAEDSGATRYIAIGNDGTTTEVKPGMVPEAVQQQHSVGIGVRREHPRGPHLGAGYGGAVLLSGDIEQDRRDVIEVLQRLLDRAERGDLDDILEIDSPKQRASGSDS